MNVSPQTLETLSNRGYMFSVNTVSLIKSMEKANFKTPASGKLLNDASEIANILLDVPDQIDESLIERDLRTVFDLVQNYFDTLQTFQTTGALANEKADLHIDAFKLRKELAKLLDIKLS